MVYITNKTKNTTTAIALQSTTKTITLEHGQYNFKAVGWDGAEVMQGNLLCGEATADLKDPKATVEINIIKNNCESTSFVPAAYKATGGVASLQLISCSDLSLVNAYGTSCDDSQRGTVGSYRVRLASFEADSSINPDIGLTSPCIVAQAFPNGTTSAGIRLPYGSSTGSFATTIETFSDASCTSGKEQNYYPFGLAFAASTGSSSEIYTNGYYVSYYTQRAPPLLAVTPITISSSNPTPVYAKIGDTVILNFTASRAASFTVKINNNTVTPTNSSLNYTATYVLTATDLPGVVSYEISAEGASFVQTTNFSQVMFLRDIMTPMLTLNGISPSTNQMPSFILSNLEAGNSVSLYSDYACSNLVVSDIASGSSHSLISSPLTPGLYQFSAKQIDVAGNVSACSGPVHYEYQTINVSNIQSTSNNTTNNAFAKTGDVITTTFTSNYPAVFTATINGTTIPANNIGGNNYQFAYPVTVGDPNGNPLINITANGSVVISGQPIPTITIDNILPSVPAISRNSPTADAGHEKQLYIQASNLEIGGQVKIYYDPSCSTMATQLPNSTSSQILTVSGLGVQQYQFYSRQYDPAGNASPCSAPLPYRVKAPFISTWRTTAAGETIVLPLPASGATYNFKVDWGDSTSVTTHTDYNVSHTYAVAGDYTVTITGTMEAWSFNGTGSKDKIRQVTDFGEMGWKNLYGAFKGCQNLTTFNGGVYAQVTNMGSMFAEAPLVTPNTSTWNTSNVTNMSSLFYHAIAATPDTTNWDTSNVTVMESMFDGATLANPNTMNWNTSQVSFMRYMFRNATAANPNTATWNTASVTNMGGMFQGAINANPNTSGWNTNNVIEMHNMFNGATIANPNTSAWSTSNVTTMDSMFKNAVTANPDTSNWDTSSVTMMTYMFYGATAANPNPIGWDLSQVDNITDIFYQSDIDVTNWSNFLVQAALTGQSGVGITLEAPNVYNPAIFDANAQTALTNRGWTVYNNNPQ